MNHTLSSVLTVPTEKKERKQKKREREIRSRAINYYVNSRYKQATIGKSVRRLRDLLIIGII